MNLKPQVYISLSIYLAILLGSTVGFAKSSEVDSVGYLSSFEKEVLLEINMARTNPQRYASFLEAVRKYYAGKQFKRSGEIAITTREGTSAVDEAIRFLRSVMPLSPLRPSKGMSLGARDHAREQGANGMTGHLGIDGDQPGDRVNRYGTWQKEIGENISYGHSTARDVVMGLIIDDGVPGRTHRENLFNPNFRVAGVSCRSHATYGTVCVITLAAGYIEKTGR